MSHQAKGRGAATRRPLSGACRSLRGEPRAETLFEGFREAPTRHTVRVTVGGRPSKARRFDLRIRIRDHDEAEAFLRFLEQRSDVVATRAYPPLSLAREETLDEVELAVVASLSEEAMRLEIALLLRAWEAARSAEGKQATVELM